MSNFPLPIHGMSSFILILSTLFSSSVFASNHEAATTQGSFGVSGGTASYSIPISIPPGMAGMEPSVSLNYSSQSGDGLLGVGWSIGGLSQISRCSTTIEQDGFVDHVDYDDNDKFCLDGQRLVAVNGLYGESGTEYRTEKESFLRITSYGGVDNDPDHFIVKNKAGQTKFYGTSQSSQVEAQGRTDNKKSYWALHKVEDIAQNFIEYVYDEDTGNATHRIDSINYGANTLQNTASTASVKFIFESRLNHINNYQAGSEVNVVKKLARIETYTGSIGYTQTLVRTYNIDYERTQATKIPRIKTITECDVNSKCKLPITFNWTDFSLATTTKIPYQVENINGMEFGPSGDFDGDGLVDFISYEPFNNIDSGIRNNARTQMHFSSGDGTFSKKYYLVEDFQGIRFGPSGDFNGDGLTDFFSYEPQSWDAPGITNNARTQLHLANGDGTFTKKRYSPNNVQGLKFGPAGDFNGDGLTDFISYTPEASNRNTIYSGGSNPNNNTLVHLALGNAQFTKVAYKIENYEGLKFGPTGDFNGDGLTDFITYEPQGYDTVTIANGQHTYIHLAKGDGKFTKVQYQVGNFQGLKFGPTGDFNGDGLTDFISYEPMNVGTVTIRNGQHTRVHISKGDGTFTNQYYRVENVQGITFGTTGDFNGDGMTDFFSYQPQASNNAGIVKNSLTKIHYAVGDGSFRKEDYQVDGDHGVIFGLAADFDGNGLTDFFSYMPQGSDNIGIQNTSHTKIHFTQFEPTKENDSPDLIHEIISGFGEKLTINYTHLTNPLVYKKYGNARVNDGINDVINSSSIVSSYVKPDGVAGDHSYSYKYEGMKANRLGRGGLGFYKESMTDNSTGLTSIKVMHQYFPRTGMLEWEETKLAGGQRFSYTENTWSPPIDNGNGTYSIHLSETYSESFDLNGAPGKKQKVTTTYDNDNNATYIVSDSLDGYKTETTNIYYPQGVDGWSKLDRSTVVQYHPLRGPETPRTSSFEYDFNGMLKSETIEPGNPNFELTTSYTYDSYGNKETVTVNGHPAATYPVPTRTTTSRYVPSTIGTATPQIETINTLGHKETKTYDARFGVVTALTGPNGLTTTWGYDDFGKKTREDRADGTWTTIDYYLCETPCGYGANIKVTTQTKGNAPGTIYYDQLGREIMRETVGLNGTIVLRSSEYNAEGKLWKQSLPYFSGDPIYYKTTKFDLLGRPIELETANNIINKISYNGNIVTETVDVAGKNQTKISYKDSKGKLTQVIDADGSPEQAQTLYRYDGYGNLLEVEDNVGNIVKMFYDLRGQKTAMDDPDMGNWEYKYDPHGKLRYQKDAKGDAVTIDYDALGRMVKRTEAEGVSQWVYDTAPGKGIGKLHTSFNDKGYYSTHTYDDKGRPKTNETKLDNTLVPYISSVDYDPTYGRVTQTTYPSPASNQTPLTIKNVYNSQGYLYEVRNAANDAMIWRAEFDNALGAINTEMFGNGVMTVKQYNPVTTLLEDIQTGAGNLTNVQNHHYSYDDIGNLTQREDRNNNNIEDFTFDDLNRLKTTTIQGLDTKTINYDSIGNITFKTGVGDYLYSKTNAGPHAVTSAGGTSYFYDNNGNMTSGNGRTLTYTSFNKPLSVRANSTTNRYYYGADHNRIKKVTTKSNSSIAKTSYYFGKSLEVIIGGSNGTEHRHSISVGSATVQYSTFASSIPEWLYMHTDRLGSVDAITKADGTLKECMSFNAYGERRSCSASFAELSAYNFVSDTTRGFTGHEMDDEIGLINMNARMYDPVLGRFLQADTIIQFADYSQGYNRYMYINNNPLSGTDPSGNAIVGDFLETASRIFEVATMESILPGSGLFNNNTKAFFLKHKWARQAATVAASYFGGPLGAAAAAAYFTKISGGDLSDIGKAAVMAYVTTYIMSGSEPGFTATSPGGVYGAIGETFKNDAVGAVLMHGMAGGALSVANGGKFKDGFASGAVGKMVTIGTRSTDLGDGGRFAIAVMAGGLSAEAGGGKFAGGASTAAFGYLFNEMTTWNQAKSIWVDAASDSVDVIIEWETRGVKYGDKNIDTLFVKMSKTGTVWGYEFTAKAEFTLSPGDGLNFNAGAGVKKALFQTRSGKYVPTVKVGINVINAIEGGLNAAAYSFNAAVTNSQAYSNAESLRWQSVNKINNLN